MADCLQTGRDGSLSLTVHVQPGAKTTAFAGAHGDALKIRLAAPPVDGKANAALLDFLAHACQLPKSAVTLKSGQSSRRKVVVFTVNATQSNAVRAFLLGALGHASNHCAQSAPNKNNPR